MDCEGTHPLHHKVLAAFSYRHTHDAYSLAMYIGCGDRECQAEAEDALLFLECQGVLKRTPANWFCRSTCRIYDDPPPKPPKRTRRK